MRPNPVQPIGGGARCSLSNQLRHCRPVQRLVAERWPCVLCLVAAKVRLAYPASESKLPDEELQRWTGGAQDRASPNFMGLASLALDIGIFYDFLYSVLLLNVILWLDFLGRAPYRPQVDRLHRALPHPGQQRGSAGRGVGGVFDPP
jgi:hypothetical protein